MHKEPSSEAAAFILFFAPLQLCWDAVDMYIHLLYQASQNTSILSSPSPWEKCKTATYPAFINILSNIVENVPSGLKP